jgi:hypothetical protein
MKRRAIAVFPLLPVLWRKHTKKRNQRLSLGGPRRGA